MPRGQISPYPLLPFHAFRALALISTIIVASILGYFSYQLKHDGFKLPWTFLIMLAASLLSFIHLAVSSVIFCCSRLSPLLNLIVGGPVLLLWTVGFALLVWNMYGALGHSCSKTNWANDDGMMICRVYKALFSFVVIGWLSLIALIIVDVRAKRTQSALGKYDKMESDKDVKLDSLNHSRNTSTNDIPYGIEDYRDRPNTVSNQRYNSPYGSEREPVRVDDFHFQAPPQQTRYESANYYYQQPTYDGIRLR